MTMENFLNLLFAPTTIIAFISASISYFQYKTNKDKLLLDLYNKRFEVYSQLIDLYLAYYKNTDDSEGVASFKTSRNTFVKYHRESQFLFDEESGVYSKITTLLEELNFLAAFLEDPNLSCEGAIGQRKSNSHKKLDTLMHEIETAMKPYLYFGNVYK